MSEPFKCPVCKGVGKVPAGFYSMMTQTSSMTPETCRSCQGTGIVWGDYRYCYE